MRILSRIGPVSYAVLTIGTFLTASAFASPQSAAMDLATRLANRRTQAVAIEEAVAHSERDIPLLLSWTRALPHVADQLELKLAMVQIFGRLRATEAIPFLIENITIQRWAEELPDTWMKATPGTDAFSHDIIGQANMERAQAEDGLRYLSEHR
ncbi:MAG: hypothetical protein WA324_28890 [Bryobacteraceae bacterium]